MAKLFMALFFALVATHAIARPTPSDATFNDKKTFLAGGIGGFSVRPGDGIGGTGGILGGIVGDGPFGGLGGIGGGPFGGLGGVGGGPLGGIGGGPFGGLGGIGGGAGLTNP